MEEITTDTIMELVAAAQLESIKFARDNTTNLLKKLQRLLSEGTMDADAQAFLLNQQELATKLLARGSADVGMFEIMLRILEERRKSHEENYEKENQ